MPSACVLPEERRWVLQWQVRHLLVPLPDADRRLTEFLNTEWELIGMSAVANAMGEVHHMVYCLRRPCGKVEVKR